MDDLQKATVRAIVNIFESGRVRGDYSAIAVLKGDKGHLSYGRSQTTLGSGNLYTLLQAYCAKDNTKCGERLKPLLPRFKARDITLDTDTIVRDLLKEAGDDPAMRASQDQFFNENYFAPALRAAESFGITAPLGCAVVYDSHIQGGWKIVSARVPKLGQTDPKDWISKYVDARTAWLQSLNPPLPSTIYRMQAFRTLIAAGNWSLTLPLQVHGVAITKELLDESADPQPTKLLRLTKPYTSSDDVKKVQAALQIALQTKGVIINPDGVYGPYTDLIVKQWQKSQNITEDGIGPLSRQALHL